MNKHRFSSLDLAFIELVNSEVLNLIFKIAIFIGSSVEFDWCAVGCLKELRRLGHYTLSKISAEFNI